MKVPSHKGFTLIELMIVIAIMGIMTAMAAPNYRTFMAQRRLSGAARQVMSDLMNARMMAVAQNRNVQVAFQTSAYASYTVDAAGTTPVVKNIQTLYGYYDVTVLGNNNPTFAASGRLTAVTNPTITLGSTTLPASAIAVAKAMSDSGSSVLGLPNVTS